MRHAAWHSETAKTERYEEENMKKEFSKTFDLTVQRPQVLLIGNGIARSASNNPSWAQLIEKMADTPKQVNDLPQGLPYSLRATVCAPTEDKPRRERYRAAFEEYHYAENENLKRLLDLPLDAVLTANYTYEAEFCLDPQYPNRKPDAKRNRAHCTAETAETKYLLRTFNRINGRDIWHIHGELRNPSSMILTHDEYARLVSRMVQYFEKRKDAYGRYQQEVYFKSWLDYLILGDIYILGLGFDFSEFDLWWLLNRRLRERTETGNVIFYGLLGTDGKPTATQKALQSMGVTVKTFDCCTPEENDPEKDEKFRQFYTLAVDDIEKKLNKNR